MLHTHAFSPAILFSFFFFQIFSQKVVGQEQLGMRLERYAGIYSAGINPANTAFTPQNWELSLFNADLFLENSYGFLRNTSVQNALRHTDQIVSITDTSRENPLPRNAIIQDFYNPSRSMHLVVQARVAGPSFSFRFGDSHVVGLTTAMRSQISSYGIPQILAYGTVSHLPRNKAVNIPPVGVSGMVWSEIGLHYSHLIENDGVQIAWGVSPKFLMGYEGFYTRAQSKFDYTQRMGDTVAFGSAKWDYAFTAANATNDPKGVALRRQGSGLGLDMGIAWAMPDEGDEGGYRWRAGVSLIDAGFVRFKNTARKYHIEFDTLIAVNKSNFPKRKNIDDLMGDVSKAFLGDSSASSLGHAFGIGLPMALSGQFDVKIAPMFYASGLIVQRISFSKYSLKRPNTLAIVPRFEHRWGSISLPLVVNDWRTFRVGAAVRLAWLYFGTDNIGSFFTQSKLSGTDFYVGLKINAFNLNVGKREKGYHLNKESGNRKSGPNWRKIKCYKF